MVKLRAVVVNLYATTIALPNPAVVVIAGALPTGRYPSASIQNSAESIVRKI